MSQRRQRRCAKCGQPMRAKGGLCDDCRPRTTDATYERHRGSARDRGYTAAWEKTRKAKLRLTPLCERHGRMGKIVAATVVHHKRELEGIDDPGRLTMGNLESLCRGCHETIHGRRAATPTDRG